MPKVTITSANGSETELTKAEQTARRRLSEPMEGVRTDDDVASEFSISDPYVTVSPCTIFAVGMGAKASLSATTREDLSVSVETDASASSLIESRKRLS